MNNINDKTDAVDTLPADEFNPPKNEWQNFVTDSGQALAGGSTDNHQSTKAGAVYATSADYYNDSGAANAYVLTPIPPLLASPTYRDGERARFIAGNSNTTSSTANIAGKGDLPIRDINGNDLVANTIIAGQQYELQYLSGSPNQLRIINSSAVKLKSESRNLLINPDFEISQRSTLPVVVNNDSVYRLDRWISRSGGGGIATCSRQPVAAGDKLPGESGNNTDPFFYRHDQTTQSNAGLFPSLIQRVDGVRAGDNVSVTVSFYARINSGSSTVTPVISQVFGTGSITPPVTITGTAIGIDALFKRYQQTVFLPSIGGADIQAAHHIEVGFQMEQGNIFQVDFRRCQVEYGMYATDFVRRDVGEELELCQRFFEKSYSIDVDPGSLTTTGAYAYTSSGVSLGQSITTAQFAVNKISVPSIAIYSPATGAAGFMRNTDLALDVAATLASPAGVRQFSARAGIAAAQGINFHFTAESEL